MAHPVPAEGFNWEELTMFQYLIIYLILNGEDNRVNSVSVFPSLCPVNNKSDSWLQWKSYFSFHFQKHKHKCGGRGRGGPDGRGLEVGN